MHFKILYLLSIQAFKMTLKTKVILTTLDSFLQVVSLLTVVVSTVPDGEN